MTKPSAKSNSLLRTGALARSKSLGVLTPFAVARIVIYLAGLTLLLGTLIACQATEEPTATVGAEIETPPATSELPTTSAPEVANTPVPEESSTPLPTITSPVPTPTAPLTPTPSPPPPPEPTFYTIEPGDSLVGIAEKFNVTLDALALANGFVSPGELALIAGNELQIPLCQAHQVTSGNTLSGIAQMCNVTLDELIAANLDVIAPLGSLDAVPVGIVLKIPQEAVAVEDLDCNPEPAREQVIEYTPQPNEGIFCLAQKFELSTASIIQANIERLAGGDQYGQQALLIPPVNGAVYVVTADDVTNGLTAADLADWYDVTPDEVLDWNGNAVGDPLGEGQQLFIPGANLAFGPYRPAALEETPEAGDQQDSQNDQGGSGSSG